MLILTVAVERIHARKGLLTSGTRVGSNVEVQRLMSLTVVLTSKALFTTRPFTFKRPFFIMRAQMA